MYFFIEKPDEKPAGDYTRSSENTKEDNKAELEWKKRRSDEAVRIFLRNNPSGRAIPKNR